MTVIRDRRMCRGGEAGQWAVRICSYVEGLRRIEPTPGEVQYNCAAQAASRSTPSGVKDMTSVSCAPWRRCISASKTVLDRQGPGLASHRGPLAQLVRAHG